MYPVSVTAISNFQTGQHQEARVVFMSNTGTGLSLTITNADIMLGGLTVDRKCPFGVGNACAAEMELNLRNFNGQYNGVNFQDGEFYVSIGVKDWSIAAAPVEYIPLGYFTADESPKKKKILKIKGLDRMIKLDKNVDWTNVTYPLTVADFVTKICTDCGVTLASTISGLPNASYSVHRPPRRQDITYRLLLKWCAFMMGSNAYMDWNGQLRFAFFGDDYASYYSSECFSQETEDVQVTVSGIKYTSSNGEDFAVGSGYSLDYAGCGLIVGGDESAVLTNILSAVSGTAYNAGTFEVCSAPYLWPMDKIFYYSATVPITDISFTINQHTRFLGAIDSEAVKDLPQSMEYGSQSSLTLTSADIAYIQKMIDDAIANI